MIYTQVLSQGGKKCYVDCINPLWNPEKGDEVVRLVAERMFACDFWAGSYRADLSNKVTLRRLHNEQWSSTNWK